MLSLDSAQDLLKKCEYDLKGVSKCTSHPEYDYAIFDVVLSLSHLFEWYLKDKTISESKRLECIKEFNPFESPYDVSGDFKELYKKLNIFPVTNKFQFNIKLLCNKAKHFRKKNIEVQKKNTLSVAGNMYAGNINAVAGCFKHYKYSIELDGSNVDLQSLMEELLHQWLKFNK